MPGLLSFLALSTSNQVLDTNVLLDHFSEGAEVDLSSHSPDKGGGWISISNNFTVSSNRAVGDDAVENISIIDLEPVVYS